MEVSGELDAPGRIYFRGRNPGTHWIGDWVGPIVKLKVLENGKTPRPCWDLNIVMSSL
jgi:hypothetical protein